MKLDVLVIPMVANGDLSLPPLYMKQLEYDSEDGSLAVFQALVGGYIDVLRNCCGGRAAMVIHDDGKFEPDCHPNLWATRIMSEIFDIDDYVAGQCVLVDDQTGPNGETLGVTKDCVRWLLSKGVPIQGAVEFLAPVSE